MVGAAARVGDNCVRQRARAWVRDLWTKDVTVTVDGGQVRLSPPAAQLRKLSTLEDQFKAARFGKGSRWAVEWFDDTAGRKRKRTKTFKTKAEADAYQAELEDDQRSGRYIDPSLADHPYRALAESWYSSRRKAGEATRFQYRGDLDRYVLPRWGNTSVSRITAEAVNQWVTELQNGTAVANMERGNPTPLAPTTVKRIVSTVFGGGLRLAVRQRWIVDNPMG